MKAYFQKNYAIINEIKDLDPLEVNLLIIQLLEAKVIDFTTIVQSYVSVLSKENETKDKLLNTLALNLSSYCIYDKTERGKNLRKYIYESGVFLGFEGSPFWDKLSIEFGNEK
ncbi:hypothetical protein F0919_17995 [Taibaiella lutea]|uniref:Uncharacterized protein n=1 Tax=Taibaiella lutea TaxID=2608001 RepID=A0A5M6CCF4_9BACT|nr:hypothetical protein [Taibaiella lutea]KAA5532673.1 hypothetical protein F0919_17995 [Taibaiella lutea]